MACKSAVLGATFQQGFKAIFLGRISFVIAHRLSTIRTADRILESGTHEQLLNAKGHYHALYTRQFQQDTEAGLFATAG